MHFELFDILRLVACLLVTYSHHHTFYGSSEPSYAGISYGGLGVIAFFSISGFLLTLSQQRSSPRRFAFRRALRIYPGLIVCTFLTVLFLSIYKLQQGTLGQDYMQVLAYLKNMLTPFFKMTYFVNGVFEENANKAINGSLWTIPYEIFAYFILFVGYFFRDDLRKWWSLFMAMVFTTLSIGVYKGIKGPLPYVFEPKVLSVSLPLVAFFLASYLASFPMEKLSFILSKLCVFFFVANLFLLPLKISSLAFVGFFSTLIISSGMMPSRLSRNYINSLGDISYGFYLYSFPLQQIFVALGFSFWPSLVMSISSCTLAAFLSYRYVEKRFLFRNLKQEERG